MAALLLSAAADAAAGPASALPFVRNGGLAGMWRVRVGDAPSYSTPELDDGQWRQVVLPGTWEEHGLDGVDGPVWYRRRVILGAEPLRGPAAEDWGLLLGRTRFGAVEIWVEGYPVGAVAAGSAVPVPALHAIPVPSGLIEGRRSILVVLRVDRVAWASDRAIGGGPVGSDLIMAGHQEIASRVVQQRHAELFQSIPLLLAAVFFAVGGLYFVYLWGRWGFAREYLWFGLVAALFAANAFLNSAWVFELTERFSTVLRLRELSGLLIPVALVEFLWGLFRRSVGTALRVYQGLLLAVGAAVVATPTLGWVVDTQGIRWLLLIPLMVAGVAVTVMELRAGNRDARSLVVAGALLAVAELVAIIGHFAAWAPPLFLEPIWGFGVLFMAIALVLANRLHRMRQELAVRYRELAEQSSAEPR